MTKQGMTQMSDLAPTFDEALIDVRQALNNTRREWSGVMMSRFPNHRWMKKRTKRLKKSLGAGEVEFNAICEGVQVTICTSNKWVNEHVRVPQTSSLCVISASAGIPLAINDIDTAKVAEGHPAALICRSWASYPVWVNGTSAGTVCALNRASPHEWSKDDEQKLAKAAEDLGKKIAAWLE